MARPRAGAAIAAIIALCSIAPDGAHAQPPNRNCIPGTGPGPEGSDTLSVAAYAESLAVLGQLDRAVRARPRDGALWYRRAMVAWALATSPPERARNYVVEYTRFRQTADLSFQSATRLNPPVIEHFLMAGKFYLTSAWTNTRAASYGYFHEALKLARASGNRAEISRTAIEVARIYWRWYEGWGYQQNGADFLRAAVLLREAYDANPENGEAYHNLAMLLVDGGRWPELEALARERLMRLPRDGWTWMTVGLARQRLRDSRHAQAVFDTALAILDPAERSRLDRFERLMRPRDSAALASASPEERALIEARAWSHADPLWSQNEEAPRVEFLARVTFAELRWSVPERGIRGVDSDRGNIYVRYGPPSLVRFAAPPATRGSGVEVSGDAIGARTVSGRDAGLGPGIAHDLSAPLAGASPGVRGHTRATWSYPGMSFEFLGMRTYSVSCFVDREVALRFVERTPNRWDNIALVELDSIPTQVARFRAHADSVDVFVAAFAPARRIREAMGVDAPVRSTFWMYGIDTPDSLTTTVDVAQNAGIRWTPRVSAGRYYYRIETTADGALAAGRATNTMQMGADAATGFATSGFGISDVLLSARAGDHGTARRWNDVEVVPVLGGLVGGGELALIWENYEFARAGDAARYRVTIHLERVPPRDAPGIAGRVAAQIVGGVANLLGVTRREEPNRLTFEFDREVPYLPALLDHVTIGLGETEPGPYTLTVVVTDHSSGRAASRSMPISVVR